MSKRKSPFDEIAEQEAERIRKMPFNRLHKGYDTIGVMSEGHARAKQVLWILFRGGQKGTLRDVSYEYIESLDLIGIYGAAIAVFHDELCGSDVRKSRAVLRAWKMRWIKAEDILASLSVSPEKRINPREILDRLDRAFPGWH
jgi:hypothetical protein